MNVAMLVHPITVIDPQRCGGVERVALTELDLLRGAGIGARLYARGFAGDDPDIEGMDSFKFSSDHGRQYYTWFIERAKDADILHSQNAPLLALMAEGKRMLLHVHNLMALPYYELASKKYNRCAFACCSPFIRRYFIRNNPGIPEERIAELPNGIDTVRFKPLGGRLRNEVPRILFTGAWLKQKGIFTLLEALGMLESRGVRFEASIAGSSYLYTTGDFQQWQIDSDRHVREAASKVKSVRIVDPTSYDRMPDLYRSCDIYAFPSIWDEPFGLGIIEAMSCGLPVVGCTVGAVPEIVAHGETGLLVPPEDAAAMAGALERLIGDEGERRRMGASGRRRAEENFNLVKHASGLIKIYETLMEEAP